VGVRRKGRGTHKMLSCAMGAWRSSIMQSLQSSWLHERTRMLLFTYTIIDQIKEYGC